MQGDSLCAFCSRMKRGLLYKCCRDNNYNKLVLGQHLDDLAESFIMGAFHNGQVRTMKAHYKIEAGDVSVIRPLIYIREHQTKVCVWLRSNTANTATTSHYFLLLPVAPSASCPCVDPLNHTLRHALTQSLIVSRFIQRI